MLFMGGNLVLGKPAAQGVIIQMMQRGGKEAAIAAKLGDKKIAITGVGQIASPAAADQYFNACPRIFFQHGNGAGQMRVAQEFSTGHRSDHAGGTRAENQQIR